jgi:hypothetical protein
MGMKKALLSSMGRAPRGSKTNWVMHEFLLERKCKHNNASHCFNVEVRHSIYLENISYIVVSKTILQFNLYQETFMCGLFFVLYMYRTHARTCMARYVCPVHR